MPGSIQVSVFGAMDLTLPSPINSLSLTVCMGKREYRTAGGGELSLPVVSLREDLTVIVHDAEGEEILRTEFRIMMLLERGLWDGIFTLKNGGTLHMKLQFLLNEEDRKRIREMRDAALKMKCMEKPKIRHRSFSDDRIRCSPSTEIAETVTERILLDHSEPADPIVEPYLDQREKLSAKKIDFPQAMPKSLSVGMLSELNTQRQPKLVKEPFFLNKKAQNSILAMHSKTPRNFKCDEKIHKLDINNEESKETKNKNSDTAPHSEKSGTFITIDNDSKATGSAQSTKLAAEILSQRKVFTSVDVEKVPSIIPIIRNFETVTEKKNLSLKKKGGVALGSNASSETLKERTFFAASSEKANREIIKLNPNENSNNEQNFCKKSLPLLHESKKIELSHQYEDLGEFSITRDDGNMPQSPSNEQTGVDENNNEEESLPQNVFSVEIVKTGNSESTLESHSNDDVVSGRLYEKVESLKSGCSSICPIGILSSVWTSRHICITTGSKLLREFSESCTLSSETNRIESSSMREADTKQLKDGDSYEQGNEIMTLLSAENSYIKKSPNSLESNGGFVEQGLWIVVIIFACGLLLKGT